MSASTSIRDRATATFSTLAAIDHLAQETGRRAKAATVDRARAAVKAALAGLDNRLRAALHRHGGCARWDHDIRDEPGDDWISKASSDGHGRTIMVRCHQCRLWLWLSDDGWELTGKAVSSTGAGASRTCSDCEKDCPATYSKCPRCNTIFAPAAEVNDA